MLDSMKMKNFPGLTPKSSVGGGKKTRHASGTGSAYFLGTPKQSTDWIGILYEAPQRRRWAAACELALQRPGQAMFEVRARGDLQRQLLRRAASISST